MSRRIRSLDVVDEQGQRDLPAGDFSPWLRRTRNTLLGGDGADVPCGECTACCRSSLFIHIGPDETDTLARIPKELLFPAPGRPKGHRVLGYDEKGCCPMLVDDRCSIYEHRPRTCREYDCRVFPAAGIELAAKETTPVGRQARRWRFDYPKASDREEHAAVRAAAAFLRRHGERLTDGTPSSSARLAILALEVYEVFLKTHGESGEGPTDEELAEGVRKAVTRFESRRRARSPR